MEFVKKIDTNTIISIAITIMLAIMGFAFNSFKNSIDKQFENIDKRFVDSQNSIDKQFTYLNEKIDYKFDTLSKEIDTIKTNHIPHIQQDIQSLQQRMSSIEGQQNIIIELLKKNRE